MMPPIKTFASIYVYEQNIIKFNELVEQTYTRVFYATSENETH